MGSATGAPRGGLVGRLPPSDWGRRRRLRLRNLAHGAASRRRRFRPDTEFSDGLNWAKTAGRPAVRAPRRPGPASCCGAHGSAGRRLADVFIQIFYCTVRATLLYNVGCACYSSVAARARRRAQYGTGHRGQPGRASVPAGRAGLPAGRAACRRRLAISKASFDSTTSARPPHFSPLRRSSKTSCAVPTARATRAEAWACPTCTLARRVPAARAPSSPLTAPPSKPNGLSSDAQRHGRPRGRPAVGR